MSNPVKPVPDGFHTVTPHLIIRGAAQAIDFYKKAFGAEEIFRMPTPDGRVGHAEIRIGDSIVMLSDEFPEMQCVSPKTLNGSPAGLHIYVADVDSAFQRAVSAGSTATMPPMDAFWGDRFGKLTDPFGHQWSIATHTQDLTPQQIAKNAEAFYAEMGKGQPVTHKK
jgi:PhnB protein